MARTLAEIDALVTLLQGYDRDSADLFNALKLLQHEQRIRMDGIETRVAKLETGAFASTRGGTP